MRTIDADELLEHVYRDKLDTREAIAEMINRAPTVYESGLTWPHSRYISLHGAEGKWVWQLDVGDPNRSKMLVCSICGSGRNEVGIYNFCPVCGAKMRRIENEP